MIIIGGLLGWRTDWVDKYGSAIEAYNAYIIST